MTVGVAFGCLIGALASPSPAATQTESVLAPLAEKSLLLDIARAGNRLVAVGERGHVLLSDDGGALWRQVVVPTRSTLTAVHFADARTGIAVGHDAVVLRSTDAGETWELVYSDAEEEAPLLDVYLFDAQRGMAVGAYGYFLTTADGGSTWLPSPINEEDDFHLNHIARAPGGNLFIAAEAGFIYRADNAEGPWETPESPYEGSFFGAFCDRDDELLVFGLRGNLYRSADAGDNWETIELATEAMLTDAARLPDGRILIVGLEGAVLVGDGRGFAEFQLPGRESITAVITVDAQSVVITSDTGVRRLRLDALQPKDAAP